MEKAIVLVVWIASIVAGLYLRHFTYEKKWTRKDGFIFAGNPSLDLVAAMYIWRMYFVELGINANLGVEAVEDLGIHPKGGNWVGTLEISQKFPIFSKKYFVAKVEEAFDLDAACHEFAFHALTALRGKGFNREHDVPGFELGKNAHYKEMMRRIGRGG